MKGSEALLIKKSWSMVTLSKFFCLMVKCFKGRIINSKLLKKLASIVLYFVLLEMYINNKAIDLNVNNDLSSNFKHCISPCPKYYILKIWQNFCVQLCTMWRLYRSPALQADSLLSELPGKPKNPGMDSLSLLQGIFLIQGLNWGLLHCRQIHYQLSYQGSPNYHLSSNFKNCVSPCPKYYILKIWEKFQYTAMYNVKIVNI